MTILSAKPAPAYDLPMIPLKSLKIHPTAEIWCHILNHSTSPKLDEATTVIHPIRASKPLPILHLSIEGVPQAVLDGIFCGTIAIQSLYHNAPLVQKNYTQRSVAVRVGSDILLGFPWVTISENCCVVNVAWRKNEFVHLTDVQSNMSLRALFTLYYALLLKESVRITPHDLAQ